MKSKSCPTENRKSVAESNRHALHRGVSIFLYRSLFPGSSRGKGKVEPCNKATLRQMAVIKGDSQSLGIQILLSLIEKTSQQLMLWTMRSKHTQHLPMHITPGSAA